MTVTTLTEGSFDEFVKSSEAPVLVDFWAEWCQPCKTIAPILDEIATERDGALEIGKLNVDEHQAVAMRFNVRSIPTLILFKDGEPVETLVGARAKADLLARIDDAV